MDMVIVGSIGYDDIQTPAESGSDLLGGAAVYSGLAASFHLRTKDDLFEITHGTEEEGEGEVSADMHRRPT